MTLSTAAPSVQAGEPLIQFRDVHKTYASGRSRNERVVTAVDSVTLDIAAGSVVGMVGYSGAGKSTLLRLINALERPSSGKVIVNGVDITELSEDRLRSVRSGIGMIFQHFNLFSSRTVAGNVAYPLRVAGVSRSETEERVAELLAFVGLSDKADVHPSKLSGGQKQRVGIARALANNPNILLADEATSALDPETTHEVLSLLKRVNREFGTTIVVITHEMSVVSELCDRVVVLENGRVVEHGATYDVFAKPKQSLTRSFVRTTVPDTPDGDTLTRLAAQYTGSLAAVRISDSFSAAHAGRIFTEHGLSYGLVHGGLTQIRDRPLGTLIFEVLGPDDALKAALADLRGLTSVSLLDANAPDHRSNAVVEPADAPTVKTEGEGQ